MGDSLEHLGAWDCYTRLLPCLHCRGEKGKPCAYFETLVMPLPHVLGPKYERLQRPLNSKEFRIGESQGNLSHDLRRGRLSSP